MRKVARYISIILVVLLTTFGLLILTVRERLLTPDLYIGALENAGVYTQVAETVEEFASEALTQIVTEILTSAGTGVVSAVTETERGAEIGTLLVGKAVGLLEGNVVQNEIDSLVRTASQNIALEDSIRTTTNGAIEGTLAWLKSDAAMPEALSFIPSVEQVETLEKEGLIRIAAGVIIQNAVGLGELPQCKTPGNETENLNFINSRDFDSVYCTSNAIQNVIKQEIDRSIPVRFVTQLQSYVDQLVVRYGIESVIDTLIQSVKSLAYMLESISEFRNFVQMTQKVGIVMLLFSVPFAIFVHALSDSNRRKTLAEAYFTVGLILIVTSLVYMLAAPEIVQTRMHFDRLTIANQALSPARNALLTQSITQAATDIVRGAFDYTLITGIIISVLSLIFINLRGFSKNKEAEANVQTMVNDATTSENGPESDSDLEDEIEDNAENSKADESESTESDEEDFDK